MFKYLLLKTWILIIKKANTKEEIFEKMFC